MSVVRVGGGNRLAVRAQPLLHHLDLVALREIDALRQRAHVVALASPLDERGHLECLSVMADHALHELHVGVGEQDGGEIRGLFRRDVPAGLARSPRLDDRGRRLAAGGDQADERGSEQDLFSESTADRSLTNHVLAPLEPVG